MIDFELDLGDIVWPPQPLGALPNYLGTVADSKTWFDERVKITLTHVYKQSAAFDDRNGVKAVGDVFMSVAIAKLAMHRRGIQRAAPPDDPNTGFDKEKGRRL